MNNEQNVEGVIDNIRELTHWYPVLSLLEELRTEKDTAKKLDKLLAVGRFVLKTLGSDPNRARAFLVARLSVETIQRDPRWLALVEELLLPK